MIQVGFDVIGGEAARRDLNDFVRRQIPFAQAVAATRTAKIVAAAEVEAMRSSFDRPTRFTLNSLRVKPATKARPEAHVWVKDEATKNRAPTQWLLPEVHGGDRSQKGLERALQRAGVLDPGKWITPADDAPLDAHGNLNRGWLQKVLSSLQAQQDPYANSTGSRRSARNRRRFFVLRRGSRVLGIAERTGYGRGSRHRIRVVLAFTGKPSYPKRLDFHGVAERTVRAELPRHYEQALREAVLSAR